MLELRAMRNIAKKRGIRAILENGSLSHSPTGIVGSSNFRTPIRTEVPDVPDLALGCASCIEYSLSLDQFAAPADPASRFPGESRIQVYTTSNPLILRPGLKLPSLQISCSREYCLERDEAGLNVEEFESSLDTRR